jgi:hypothetical protein
MASIMQPSTKSIIVRPLATFSLLPSESFLSEDPSFVVDDAISFSATRAEVEERYYELAWCTAQEVRLYGSLIIGANPERGKIILYPMRWPVRIVDLGQDLSSSTDLEEIRRHLEGEITERFSTGSDPSLWEELPPFLKKRPYQINSNVWLDHSYQEFLWQRIDPESDLMVRGLSHMIKCGMLTSLGRAFLDTACLEIYVAMESTLEIILDRLRQSGYKNPSNRDASDYLLAAFNEPHRLDRYYAEYYDDRIKATHPNSRFGSAKFTPLYVDDLYMLYNDLLRNFEFCITGEPNCYRRHYRDAL